MPRFKINDKIYATSSLDELSLRDVTMFNSQAEDMGLRRKWSDVERVAQELAALPEDEAEQHPDKYLVLAVTVWATRRTAGEKVSFEEAIDVPMLNITLLPDPEDKKPGKPKARKGTAKKATKVSVPAESPARHDSEAETQTTSESPSTPE